MYSSKYAMINVFTELLSRHKQRFPHSVKVAFKCINEARVNAHMTLRHKKLGLLLLCAEKRFCSLIN